LELTTSLVLLAAAAVLAWTLSTLRRRGVGASHRWTQLARRPSVDEATSIHAIDFELFARPEEAHVESVFSGKWQGVAVRLFEYVYVVDDRSYPGLERSVRYACAITDVGAVLPPLVITRGRFATVLDDGVASPGITFELEAFNREFQVRSRDRRFAYDFVDQRMMRFLLQTPAAFSFETRGRWLLVAGRELPRDDTFVLLETLKAFREHVPDVVVDLYGPTVTG